MKRTFLLGGLLVGAAAVAQAQQSNVTIYGIYDTGVEYVSNIAAGQGPAFTGSGPTGSVWRMPTNTGTFGSRIGFRGTEDLGGGLSAIFTLENGFAPDTGVLLQGGRLFGRQAFVGLASKEWGQVTFGRQWSMTFWGALDTDLLGSNAFGSGSLDNYFPNAREDNSIGYRGKFGGLQVGATYSLGRDAVNGPTGPNPAATNCAGESATDKKACRAWSAMAKYDADSWGVSAIYDRQNGGTGAFAGLTNSNLTDSRAIFSGWAKFSVLKLSAAVQLRNNDGTQTTISLRGNPAGRDSRLYWLQAAYQVSPNFVVDGGWFGNRVRNFSEGDSDLFAIRATYNLSKRTAMYATAGYMKNDSNVSASVDGYNPNFGQSQSGALVGIRHFF